MQTTQSSDVLVLTTNTTAAPNTLTFRTPNHYNLGAGSGMMEVPKGVITQVDKVTETDLNSDVFNTPVETLVNLWLTRHGSEWVDLDAVMEDAVFGRIYKRLRSLGELETHYLTDRARYVCRKPE